MMPSIIPIKELKNTTKIAQLCKESSEPIYITKNGYGEMVLMSMEAYEKLMQPRKIHEELEISERQIAAGKTEDALESLKESKNKYGV